MRLTAAMFAALLLAALTAQSQEPQTIDTISIDTNTAAGLRRKT